MTTPAMPEPLGWYVVNNIGMATLCKDEAEAQLLAEDCDMVYQRQAPHRAVQLVALAALQSAQPAGHSCIFLAAPLTPGDTRGPQFAVCAICGQPPRVLGTSQPAAAVVSDEQCKALTALFKDAMDWGRSYGQRINLSSITVADVSEAYSEKARAILALRPQAVPMTWTSTAERVPLEGDGEVFVRFTGGSIGTAWATYWHGASNDFAQWTHPDPDEDRTVEFWMKPPAITAQGAQEGV